MIDVKLYDSAGTTVIPYTSGLCHARQIISPNYAKAPRNYLGFLPSTKTKPSVNVKFDLNDSVFVTGSLYPMNEATKQITCAVVRGGFYISEVFANGAVFDQTDTSIRY